MRALPWFPALLLALAQGASAELRIDVHQGSAAQVPVAVVPFVWSDPQRIDTLAEIVAEDLRRSGLFRMIEQRRMPQDDLRAAAFDPELWRDGPAEYVVTARLESPEEGLVQLDYQLWDTVSGTVLEHERITARERILRRVAHRLADIVHEKLTGVRGAFDTRIAYVGRERKGRRFHLIVADSDGHNPVALLTSDKPLLAPDWSPDGKELAYVSFEQGAAQVYLHDLATGQRRSVLDPGTQATAPAYSPDGVYLALSVIRHGGADIFLYHRENGSLSRVTRGGINTEPTWGAKGRLLFTSNRDGRPRIYRQEIDGTSATALSLPGRYNAGATLSPGGTHLALVHVGDRGTHGLYLVDLQAGSMRALSDGKLDESPTFAPNGRALIYASTDKRSRRVLIWLDRSGRIRQRLQTPYADVREPSWSPYRQ